MEKPLQRIGFSDIIVTEEEANAIHSIIIYDINGKVITKTDTFLAGYEDSDGNETDKDGNILK